VQEAFGEDNVMFNCSKDVSRLPNTCNVSLIGVDLVGHVVLSKCTNIMASVGAACHAQNIPSGISGIVLNFLLLRVLYIYTYIQYIYIYIYTHTHTHTMFKAKLFFFPH
jgi:hypothetical protein